MIRIIMIKRVTLVFLPIFIIGLYLGRYIHLAYDDVCGKPLVQLQDLKILKEIQVISGKGVHFIYTL